MVMESCMENGVVIFQPKPNGIWNLHSDSAQRKTTKSTKVIMYG